MRYMSLVFVVTVLSDQVCKCGPPLVDLIMLMFWIVVEILTTEGAES